MNIKLENVRLPQTAVENPVVSAGEAVEIAGETAVAGGTATLTGATALTVVENAGTAAIPGEEPVDEGALTRDDPLGKLVDQAFKPAKTVAQNIGESADRLRELFERNKEDAEVKERRLEAVLKAEAAKAPDDERLDALLHEAELQA